MAYLSSSMRGDYLGTRRGDPGILSVVKGVAKAAVGAATGAVRSVVTGGNPIGGAITGARTALAPASRAVVPAALPMMPSLPIMPAMPARPAVVGVSPRGTLGVDITPQSWSGYHMNRTGYYLRGGQYVAPNSRMVRNRTTNYGNARALKRGLRRAFGFQKLARAVMSFQLTGKKYSRPHFKRSRRKK